MAIQNTPNLPPLMVIINNKYAYVTTYKNVWDKEYKQARRLKGQNRTVGKILGGGPEGVIEWNEDFLLEHPELQTLTTKRVLKGMRGNRRVFEFVFEPIDEMISLTEAFNLKRLCAGATFVLDNTIANTPLMMALERTFNKYNLHKKILSLAYFMYLSNNSATWLYEDFAKKHRLPFNKPLKPSQISRLFYNISVSDIDKFLKSLNSFTNKIEKENVGKINTYYALDSTSISPYSNNLRKAQWGHNKDGDALRQINLLMLVNQETGTPLYYHTYTGNTPDVATVKNVISEFVRTGLNRQAVVVADKGYGVISNINLCLLHNINFIFNTRTSLTFSKQIIAEHLEELMDFCSYNSKIQCFCVSDKYEWSYPTLDKTPTGSAVKAKTTVYVHIYLDKQIRVESEQAFLKSKILPLLEKLKNGSNLSLEEIELKNEFIKENGKGGFLTNNKAKTEYMLNKGIRILVSNTISDPVEAWRAYYERERVEDAFKVIKQKVGGSRYRTSKNESTEGKTFVMFIACAVGMMFRQKINQAAKKGMNLPFDSDAKLLSCLEGIEQTVFRNGSYYGLVTGIHKRILESLDMPLPKSEYFGVLSKEEEGPDEDDNFKSLDELEMSLYKLEKQFN